MSKKGVLIAIISVLLVVGIVAAITVTMTTPAEGEKAQQAQTEEKKDDAAAKGSEQAAPASEKAAAEALIGENVSEDDIADAVGKWDKFEMSSAGCERGVYSGTFYYDGFYIVTRTYDKGKTFTVNAVNE